MTETCAVCQRRLERYDLRVYFASTDGKVKPWCGDCIACVVCDARPTYGASFVNAPMGLIPVPLCEEHAKKYAEFNNKPLSELPAELLSCQLKRLRYLKDADMRRANAAAGPVGRPGRSIVAYRALASDAAALDAKAKLVTEEIDKRKRPRSREALAKSLRIRLAKGEITKDDYEQMLKMLKQK